MIKEIEDLMFESISSVKTLFIKLSIFRTHCRGTYQYPDIYTNFGLDKLLVELKMENSILFPLNREEEKHFLLSLLKNIGITALPTPPFSRPKAL